jgi:hypothetical protein
VQNAATFDICHALSIMCAPELIEQQIQDAALSVLFVKRRPNIGVLHQHWQCLEHCHDLCSRGLSRTLSAHEGELMMLVEIEK